MIHWRYHVLAASLATGILASPAVTKTYALSHRAVAELNEAAAAEAHPRDETAVKAFAGTQIKTFDGKCLFVDKLSGDFRANLTPIQVTDCDATDGQGWDVIVNGTHNNVEDSMLVVSTLTGACFNFDPRRAAGSQVFLFSCGGRADGSGDVSDSQLFPYTSGAGPGSFTPRNDLNSCFTLTDNVIGIAPCASGNLDQLFLFSGVPDDDDDPRTGGTDGSGSPTPSESATPSSPASSTVSFSSTPVASQTSVPSSGTTVSTAQSPTTTGTVETNPKGGTDIPNPTNPVPVSRAGGTLQPTAAAESHERDDTATRAFTAASIQAPDGRCLFVDPTAGDFRQNLIPVSLVQCGGTPNEKFDVVTAGKHNSAAGSALLVSSLMNGCISFDGRRQAGDTVTMFSCGGRADGGGETNNGQLFPYFSGTTLTLAPNSEVNATCIVPGADRLTSSSCTGDNAQMFTIVP